MTNCTHSSLDDLPLVLTVPEAAEALRIGRNTAYNLVRCKKLRSIRVGKQLRVPKVALLEYLGVQY